MENLIKIFDKFRNFRLNKSSAEFLFYKGNLDSNISITTQFDDKDIHKITIEISAGESDSVDGYNMELNFSFKSVQMFHSFVGRHFIIFHFHFKQFFKFFNFFFCVFKHLFSRVLQ